MCSLKIGGIRRIPLRLHAQCGDLGLGSLAVLVDHQVGERHVGALAGELHRDGLADTAGRTRYDGHFSFE